MKHAHTTIALHTLNILIGIFSIAIIALVARSVALTDSDLISDIIPSDVRGTGRGMMFWPGCGGVVDMLLFGGLWVKMPRDNIKKQRIFLNGLVFVACFILGRPLVVLIYTFVEYGQADKANLSATAPTDAYTVESWSCAYAKNSKLKEAGALCTDLRVARYLLIPSIVLGAIMLPLVIWTRWKVGKEEGAGLARKDVERGKV